MSYNAIGCELQSNCDWRCIKNCLKCRQSVDKSDRNLLADAVGNALDASAVLAYAVDHDVTMNDAYCRKVLAKIGTTLIRAQYNLDTLIERSRQAKSASAKKSESV